jgi:hypothetical protein
MVLLKRYAPAGSICLLLLHVIVWACSPQPLIVHASPAHAPTAITSPDQWLRDAEIHLHLINGHFQNLLSTPSHILVQTADDLSVQTSWVTSIVAPSVHTPQPAGIPLNDTSIQFPGAFDASPRMSVPRLPPRA